MKTPIVFKADQFTYDIEKGLYVAEASTLGLKPGEVLREFKIEQVSKEVGSYGRPYLVPFTLVAADVGSEGDDYAMAGNFDTAGWRYDSTTSIRALIIND